MASPNPSLRFATQLSFRRRLRTTTVNTAPPARAAAATRRGCSDTSRSSIRGLRGNRGSGFHFGSACAQELSMA